MSDNLRRARELQRAKTAERVARGIAERALDDLVAFSLRAKDGLVRSRYPLDLAAFDSCVGIARAAAEKYTSASARLAELEGSS